MSGILTKIADIFRSADEKKDHPYTSAVILCAGSGTRFAPDGSVKKQNFLVGKVPVAVRTLITFDRCEVVDELIVVCREDEMQIFEEYRRQYEIKKLTKIVKGAASRQESSLAGCDAIDEGAKYVMIHDGARCLVTTEIIEKTARAAYSDGAAIAARRCRDTVKISDDAKHVTGTSDRDRVWLAETPQVFKANMYRAAAYMAKKDGVEVTDDASMAERLGFSVTLVDCGSQNLKITYKEDIIIAEAIISARQRDADTEDAK